MSKNEEPAIVVGKAYDLVLWLIKKVERFARSYRFSVGDRLVGQSMDLLLLLVDSAYSGDKTRLLQQANPRVHSLPR